MEGGNFDRLSAELITTILFELPTTGSLYSLIRASPKCYLVFLTSKETILFSLMRRTIKPAAFVDALTAVQASQLKDVGPDRKAVLTFLRQYEHKRHRAVEQKEQRYPLGTAVSLCQLYQSTQYFIKHLTERSNFYLDRCRQRGSVQTEFSSEDNSILPREYRSDGIWGSTDEPSAGQNRQPGPLSDVEEVRLQRAFYRYELYTQIFSSDMRYNGEKLWELPSDSRFFLDQYQHWEIEELGSVESCLWSLLSGSFDRIVTNFVGTQLPEPPMDASESTNYHTYKRSSSLRQAKFQIHSLYADYLSSLSLPFLHYALQLDRPSMQREMSSHIHYDGRKRSLSTALESYWKPTSRNDVNSIRGYLHTISRNRDFQFTDSIDKPNEGWLSVYSNTEIISPWSIQRTTQGLGYVFWDSQRLRYSGFVGSLVGIEARCQIERNVWPSTATVTPLVGP